MTDTLMKLALIGLVSVGLVACSKSEPEATAQSGQTTAQSSPPPAPDESAQLQQSEKAGHNYSMKDGFEYGYEQAISENDQKKGQAANELLMFKYAGQKNGQYQVYAKSGAFVTVAQCGNPCEFIKVMTFYQKSHIKTERLRAVDGMIGWMVLQDAINGHMEQWKSEKNGKKGSMWFTEEGPKFTPDS